MDMRVIGRTVPRPPIIALAPDVDGDGPKLVREGQNYRDNDATNRDRMFDFSVTLDDLEDPVPNTANVTVSYTGARRAQLMISPGGTRGNFKSADIRLENPVSQRESVIKGATNKSRSRCTISAWSTPATSGCTWPGCPTRSPRGRGRRCPTRLR